MVHLQDTVSRVGNIYGTWQVIDYHPDATKYWLLLCLKCNGTRKISAPNQMKRFEYKQTACENCRTLITKQIRHHYIVDKLNYREISQLLDIPERTTRAAIYTLNKNEKRYRGYYTSEEIAQALGISTQVVNKTLKTALNKLSEILREKYGDNMENYFDYK